MVVLALAVIVLGCLLVQRADSQSAVPVSTGTAVYGPVEVKEMAIRWTDRDDDMVYGDKTRVTIFPEWLRIDEPAVGSPRKFDITFVPRTRVREITIVKP
jgi:hypothetical protein